MASTVIPNEKPAPSWVKMGLLQPLGTSKPGPALFPEVPAG